MKRPRLFFAGPIMPLAAVLLFFSCASNPEYYHGIDAAVSDASYSDALSRMESPKVKKNIYPPKNAVLYYLDKGMVEHYAGQWKNSTVSLQTAERLIEETFTKSISQEISAYITNDYTRDYPGEDYEDLYTNVFGALNYYHLGNLEDALVEIRRLNEKLLYLSTKYERAVDKVVSSNGTLENERNYSIEASRFSNSALARYLGVLFYRAVGNRDSSRIDMEKLYEAYELAPSVYYHPPPASLEDELFIPPGQARLNLISFTGLAPVKEEVFIDFNLPYEPDFPVARLALPMMADRPSDIRGVEVILYSAEYYEKIELELLEDMGAVARETFKAQYNLILLKSAARFILKNSISVGVAVTAGQRDERIGVLAGVIGMISAVATERADVRISRYFPAYAYVGGINLDPGTYSIQVNYYGSGGLICSERQENIQVMEGRLNLREFVCLK